jgi:hypothetical protein
MPPKRGRDDDGGGEESAKRSRGGEGGGRTVSGEGRVQGVRGSVEVSCTCPSSLVFKVR